jgi:hypothetical protein
MSSKPIELPPHVAKAFIADMRTFFAAKNSVKKDEIAARQLHVLRAYQGPCEKPLKLIDVREMFLQMKDQA